MKNDIFLIGLNHKTADVEVRERFALSDKPDTARRLVSGPVREAMALSTCNRVEVLAVGSGDVIGHVAQVWAGACGQPPRLLEEAAYVHRELDAVRHVFSVASSLDSMVVGEPQILGQLKDAYRAAVDLGTARVIVNRLLHKAFFVAKRVRTETEVASSAVSISYAAVELAKKIFGELAGKRAMLVGAGEMAELAAQNLLSGGIEHIVVANRTLSRAEELAARFRGTPIAIEDMYEHLHETDIVISSTGSPTAVIRAQHVRDVLRRRRNRPMFFIDIAVPRDIDPDVNLLDNVYLYDIDDLREVVEENLAQRRGEAERAATIVAAETESFAKWLSSLSLHPTIRDLMAHGEDLARRELAKTLRRLGPDVDDRTRESLETLVLSIAQKLYHEPVCFLKRRAQEEGGAERFIDLSRRMFNLDRESIPPDAHADRKPSLTDDDACDCGLDEPDGTE
ncbi:Glutamyl-tRNA reductase [Desulfovibrio sp. X2]|uniref:glutamyl-tRNA reductase n=1 Tax=Desulfovibrio sp. X2 TaxID=941449 RepID=UPI000358AA7B|nr:glutamyl-tRNA reductase [Desulfovibrio sp. X2]EPR42318.1 Glutamyl-tRNA reductase [Desulfovibrio sp. X2]